MVGDGTPASASSLTGRQCSELNALVATCTPA